MPEPERWPGTFNCGAEDDSLVVLDPFDDNRSGCLFVTHANGARADALLSNGDQNKDWDGVWDVRSRWTDEGWLAELRIPFATLRFPSDAPREWGINFERSIRRLEVVPWEVTCHLNDHTLAFRSFSSEFRPWAGRSRAASPSS